MHGPKNQYIWCKIIKAEHHNISKKPFEYEDVSESCSGVQKNLKVAMQYVCMLLEIQNVLHFPSQCFGDRFGYPKSFPDLL